VVKRVIYVSLKEKSRVGARGNAIALRLTGANRGDSEKSRAAEVLEAPVFTKKA
jgi:hypothetical protein